MVRPAGPNGAPVEASCARSCSSWRAGPAVARSRVRREGARRWLRSEGHRPIRPKEVRPMRPYEVMVILDADLDEETIRGAVARYTSLTTSMGAEPGPIDYWGKRRFAYEIKH